MTAGEKQTTTTGYLPWIVLFAIGLYAIIQGVVSSLNYILILVGSAFSLGSIFEIRSVHLKISRQSGTENYLADQSDIKDSTVFGNIRAEEFHFHNTPQAMKEEQSEAREKSPKETKETVLLIARDTVEFFAYQEYPVDLKKGDVLRGHVESEISVSVLLLTTSSFNSFKQGYEIRPIFKRPNIFNTDFAYQADIARKALLVIHDPSVDPSSKDEEDEEESDYVTVSINVEQVRMD